MTGTLKEGYNVTKVTSAAEKAIEKYDLPKGTTIEFTGENETIMDAMEDLVLMLILGIVFVYLIMVAQFQSLKSPFIIMFTIPLAFTGGLAGAADYGERNQCHRHDRHGHADGYHCKQRYRFSRLYQSAESGRHAKERSDYRSGHDENETDFDDVSDHDTRSDCDGFRQFVRHRYDAASGLSLHRRINLCNFINALYCSDHL